MENKIDSRSPMELNFKNPDVSWATLQYNRKSPHKISILFVYFMFFILFSVFVYSYFAEMIVTVETKGRLVGVSPPVQIPAMSSFTVSEAFVKENQRVKKGDLLVSSRHTVADSQAKEIQNYLNKTYEIAQKYSTRLCSKCSRELENILQQYYKIKAEGEVNDQLASLNDLLVNFKSAAIDFESLPSYLSSLRLSLQNANKKLARIRQQNGENILYAEVESLKSQAASAKAAISERTQGVTLKLHSLRDQILSKSALLRTKVGEWSRDQSIVAPFDGIVTNFQVTGSGQFISVGQTVLELVPDTSGLIAELDVNNSDISRLRQKMEALVKVDAFPEVIYGHLLGEVQEIPVNVTRAAIPGDGNMHFYKVKVQLSSQSFHHDGGDEPLILGMTIRARIIVRKASVLRLAYEALFKIKERTFEQQ